MTTYSLKSCEDLIEKYLEIGGEVQQLEEGVLGLGKLVLTAEGKKTTVITEVYRSPWVSDHTVRMYNKTPKKYQS